ncbi:STAS domain-containing protein [Streptomyces sp. NPDC050264]|uniref:STAS domain-containing protein n=1 Tax=Streptomyces sp. NPDC050264 TaxID=3155038 RepID=UPI0034445BA7
MVPDRQSIDVTRQNRVAVVSFRNAIDLDDATEAALALSNARTDTSTAGTLLELADLTFADSTLLNVILRAHTEHQAALRPFVLTGPYHSGVQRLFEITGVTSILDLADTHSDGVRRVHELLATGSTTPPETPAP